jgi:di/tricarboxylate transporter
MGWEGWVTLGVLLVAIVIMVRDVVAPVVAILGATILLYVIGVIDAGEAFAGFANPAPLTITVLYVLAGAASRSGALQPLVRSTLSAKASDRANLIRLLPPVTVASSVLNNTPIVAVMVPELQAWARRHGRAVSRLLMPISFAAILGGTVTVIGTSTNLVVSGLLEVSGEDPLGFFELAPVGIPIILGGLTLLTIMAPRVLDRAATAQRHPAELAREWVIDLRVRHGQGLDGLTVEETGFLNLARVELCRIETDRDTIDPPPPDHVLRGGDLLRFVGNIYDVSDMLSQPGLSTEEVDLLEFNRGQAMFFEAVIGPSSRLVGLNARQSGLRSRYRAAMLAIHRPSGRVGPRLSNVIFESGDKLVIVATPRFQETWRDRRDFLLVSPLTANPPPVVRHRAAVAAILGAVVIVAGLGWLTILRAAVIGAVAVLAMGVLTAKQAARSIDVGVVVLVASGFGLGAAMSTSGLAHEIASGITGTLGSLGSYGALAAIVLVTILLTESISNTAAALIVFPVAVATATGLDLEPRGFAVAVALAASASFLTPVGYQTNAMVQAPGGYRFRDYSRLGFPLTALVYVAILIGVPIVWPL